jgi:N-acetylmuramoyl-L-alanine amidase
MDKQLLNKSFFKKYGRIIITVVSVIFAIILAVSFFGSGILTWAHSFRDAPPNTTIHGSGKISGCGIPDNYAAVFNSVTEKYSTSPALLAAIFYAGEHAKSWPTSIDGPWADGPTDSRGFIPKGPFQFKVNPDTSPDRKKDTWDQYGLGGDVQDIYEAVIGAANMFDQNIAKGKGDTEHNIRNAIANYNSDPEYVDRVYAQYLEFLSCVTVLNLASECESTSTTSSGNNVIVLDPGHGTKQNVRSDSGEQQVNLEVAKQIKILLMQAGYTVYMTHDTIGFDTGVGMGDNREYLDNVWRANFANSKNPGLTLRIHADTGSSNGFFLEYPEANLPDSGGTKGPSANIASASKQLAQKINNSLQFAGLTVKNSGLEPESYSAKAGHNLVMSTHSTDPLILIEMFGMGSSNAKSQPYQQKMASGLANAIKAAVSLSTNTTATSNPMSPNCVVANYALQVALSVKNEQPSVANMPIKTSAYAKEEKTWTNYSACNRFVAYVMQKSGIDTQFSMASVLGQFDYVKQQGTKYDLLPITTGLKPGDIIIRGYCSAKNKCTPIEVKGHGHIEIYTGGNSTFPGMLYVSASLQSHGPIPQAGRDANMGIIVRLKSSS